MKNTVFAITGAAMLAAAGVVGGALISSAEAQSNQRAPVILTVNWELVLSQTEAGKSIPAQAEEVRKSVERELNAEAEKLKKDFESFQKNKSLMSEEVRQQTQQELSGRYQVGLPQRVQIMDQALNASVQTAQAKIVNQSEPIIKEIIDKRGATVVLNRSAVMYAAPETDVTQEVIAELDKKFPAVEVEKVSLADLEKRIREAQAQQAQAQNN